MVLIAPVLKGHAEGESTTREFRDSEFVSFVSADEVEDLYPQHVSVTQCPEFDPDYSFFLECFCTDSIIFPRSLNM